MPTTSRNSALATPADQSLPYFVYGALKPGMPAFLRLRDDVAKYQPDFAWGELLVRDGLPMLLSGNREEISGVLLTWKPGHEDKAYQKICEFEPRAHYRWEEVELLSGARANALVIRYDKEKGNAQLWGKNSWDLKDDPAFGLGLVEVEAVLREVDAMPGGSFESEGHRFFRSQMAYLLLWSILERLSALCIGPAEETNSRIKRLHELPGMEDIVRKHVKLVRKVSDSRDPDSGAKLDPGNAKTSFNYYYQVRSNLSHRGKAVFKEFEIVHSSLRELLGITKDFLEGLQSSKERASGSSEPSNPTIP